MKKQSKPMAYTPTPLPMLKWIVEERGSVTLYLDRSAQVTVHKFIGCGDTLFVSCGALDVSQRELDATNLEDAKAEAITRLQDRASYLLGRLQEVKL